MRTRSRKRITQRTSLRATPHLRLLSNNDCLKLTYLNSPAFPSLMAYTGMRIGEVRLKKGDVGVNTVTITDGKTDSSNRVAYTELANSRAQALDFNWASNTYLNEQVKAAGPDITCHSLRHGWKRLSREAELDSVLGEAFLGHSLKGLEGTYGDGFSVDALRRGAQKVWRILDTWRLEMTTT